MKNTTINKEIFSWIKSFILAVIIAFICRQFLFSPVTVSGESMMPAYKDRNKVIVGKITKIEHFDTVVFKSPNSNENYIKRVIGLPGDTVEVEDDILFINGKEHKEPYLSETKKSLTQNVRLTDDFTLREVTGESKVPKDCFFVMGDNRNRSNDSRRFGFVSKEALIGEVKFRYYPFNEMGQPY